MVKPRASGPISPYLVPGFYDRALAEGRHRDIVGGRWEETGEAQMRLLLDAGLRPEHRVLDIGAGSLRLGCLLVPWLEPGNYWATDLSGALMRRGWEEELADKDRLPLDHLVEDGDFSFPGLPEEFDFAICFAVFTHLPPGMTEAALARIGARFPRLKRLLFTVFQAPEGVESLRQRDGVVTHASRPPWHVAPERVAEMARAAGFRATPQEVRLPRGQVLWLAEPASSPPQMP